MVIIFIYPMQPFQNQISRHQALWGICAESRLRSLSSVCSEEHFAKPRSSSWRSWTRRPGRARTRTRTESSGSRTSRSPGRPASNCCPAWCSSLTISRHGKWDKVYKCTKYDWSMFVVFILFIYFIYHGDDNFL